MNETLFTKWINSQRYLFRNQAKQNLNFQYEDIIFEGPTLSVEPRKRSSHRLVPPFNPKSKPWIEVDNKTCYRLYSGDDFISFYTPLKFYKDIEFSKDEMFATFEKSLQFSYVTYLLCELMMKFDFKSITGDVLQYTLGQFCNPTSEVILNLTKFSIDNYQNNDKLINISIF